MTAIERLQYLVGSTVVQFESLFIYHTNKKKKKKGKYKKVHVRVCLKPVITYMKNTPQRHTKGRLQTYKNILNISVKKLHV